MAVRIDQEPILIGTSELTSTGGHVRANQEAFLLGVNANSSPGNVLLNQEIILLLVPTSLQGARVQIVGGPFQDALGNALSNGYLIMQLQHDAASSGAAQIAGNISVKVPLDVNGYIEGTVIGTPVYIWPNSILVPGGGNYLVWLYTSTNQLAWDNPQVQTVADTNPFNVNTWVPGP